ncbi:DUF421 domain-containing protein [Cytobacillus kochii]|uniref:DUF421 domain-containing protein n=1 Tax=Cytobacillus kochii TaxID=859143 RepID=UPI0027853867|nr:YetF domain-containing protein [Cytobacillus kochii]MDQ0184109.1 uncharacterized membrane protein YcaP (DUF421 family) [Cytobacillus kochii]
MEFFTSQESLTIVQWMLRAIVGFVFFVILVKLMGQRSLSQVGLLDFVIVLIIGNIIAHPLSDEGLGLEGSMITMSVILILYIIGIYLSLHFRHFRKWFITDPIPLIENGMINNRNMKRARISLDELQTELRMKNIEEIQKVALALWEHGGKVSIFLKTEHLPLTAVTFSKPVKPFYFPNTVIKEGTINCKQLHQLGRDEEWILKKLQDTYPNITIKDILLGTVDDKEDLSIFLYNS